jgi:hypothetical protein
VGEVLDSANIEDPVVLERAEIDAIVSPTGYPPGLELEAKGH